MRMIGRRAADGSPKQVAFMDDFGDEVEVRRCLACRRWLPASVVCFTPRGRYLDPRCLPCVAAKKTAETKARDGREHLPTNGVGPGGVIYVRGMRTTNRVAADGTIERRCARCKRWLDRGANFVPLMRADGHVTYDAYCLEDRAAHRREQAAKETVEFRREQKRKARERIWANPVLLEQERARKREAGRLYRLRNPEGAKAARDRYQAKIRADPVRREAQSRKWAEARRLRELEAGRSVRVAEEAPMDPWFRQGGFLPAGPLAAAMREQMLESGEDLGAYCQRVGVNPRSFRAWDTGERAFVRRLGASRVLAGLDLTWHDVWPNEPA